MPELTLSPPGRDYEFGYGAGGHEQLISNSSRFKPAFSKGDKKQTLIVFKEFLQTGLKTSYSMTLYLGLWALCSMCAPAA
jgi:hypothetical protein